LRIQRARVRRDPLDELGLAEAAPAREDTAPVSDVRLRRRLQCYQFTTT